MKVLDKKTDKIYDVNDVLAEIYLTHNPKRYSRSEVKEKSKRGPKPKTLKAEVVTEKI